MKSLLRRHPKIAALCLTLAGLASSATIAELVFYLLLKNGPNPQHVGSFLQCRASDKILTYKAQANCRGYSSKIVEGKPLYQVLYSVDEYSRRITPMPSSPDRSRHLIFLGGSFTFGEGVENSETMPAQIAKKALRHHVYNYGYEGYGPQQLLGILRSPIQVQVPESQGKAIYTFIDHHVYRAIGSLDVVVAWGSRLPYYRISHQGNLVREGTFRNSRPLLHLYYKILGMSHTLAYVGYNLPSQIQQPHFALTSKIIETARDEYLKKFPKGEFYVLLYPGNSFNAQMTRFLEEAKVKTLDYSSLFNPNDPAHHIHLDGHPSKKAYQLIAQQIVKDLRLDLKSNVELSGHRLDEDRSL